MWLLVHNGISGQRTQELVSERKSAAPRYGKMLYRMSVAVEVVSLKEVPLRHSQR